MRTRLSLLAAGFLLAAWPAWAQTPQAPTGTPAPVPASSLTGIFDVGPLFSTVDGDEARFERYRDDRDGLFSNLSLNRLGTNYLFDATAQHVGYRDQRYSARLLSRKVNATFDFSGVPLNYSYIARTPFVTSITGDQVLLSLDDAAQRAVQGPTFAPADGSAVGVPCAPGAPPASCSTPANAALAKTNRSIYNGLASEFEMRHTRNTSTAALNYAATRAVDLDVKYQLSTREGAQPFGVGFAFNNAQEIAKPLDERTDDVGIGASWGGQRGSFRLGWDGSWFTNHLHSLVWDNPIFLTDYTNGLLPPAGPYDPSGYSNGNGPAQGRIALMPSNQMQVVSATGLYKMARRTSVNGTLQFTTQTSDEELIPWTTNSFINNPAVLAAFHQLAELPRETAQAEAKGINAMASFTTRPSNLVGFNVRYRFNDRDVQTPPFDAREYVRFDAVPEEIEEGISHQFDTRRQYLDANVSLTPLRWGTVKLGYGHEAVERHGRGFADVGEHIIRLSWDTYSNQYVSLRTSFDSGWRRGEGLVETNPISESEDLTLITGPGGTQPTLRYYDEADRDRIRGTVLFTVMPASAVDVYAQYTAGRDKYLPDDTPVNRPGELFGLLKSDTSSVNVGFNFHPTEVVALGANYGRDTFGSFQKSRNANPPPDPSWVDPNRDWTMDNGDTMNNWSVYLDLLRALRNTDVRFSYDYTDSENQYQYGGPRIAALSTLGQFIPLPDVENSWHRATADATYFFTAKAGLGLGYYFETFDVADWATIDAGGPVGFAPQTNDVRIDWLGALITGYAPRPYTGNTVYARVIYKF